MRIAIGQLPPIGVADYADVGEPQRRLLRFADFTGQQDGARACAEGGTAPRGMGKQSFIEAFLDKKFPLRRAFAARKNHGIYAFHIAGRAYEHVFDAHSRKRGPVRFKISLNSEYPDFHAFFLMNFSVPSVEFLRGLCVKFRKVCAPLEQSDTKSERHHFYQQRETSSTVAGRRPNRANP